MTEREFWKIMDKADWKSSGDDKVLAPVIDALSKLDDKDIFGFEDMMSELLYELDSRELALELYGSDSQISGDMFLYQRCVALINGPKYYKKILTRKEKLDPDLEFEAILYVPHRAWAKKHQADPGDYPHFPEISYETCSNKKLW